MKKILIVAFALVAMTFASCGSKTQSANQTKDTDSIALDSDSVAAHADSALVDSAK